QRRNTTSRGSNGLLPFIELNGQQTADSEFIIKRLTEHFHLKNFPDDHTDGLGFAVERMIENHTMLLLRFDMGRTLDQLTREYLADNNVPSIFVPLAAPIGGWRLRRKLRRIGVAVIGRFSDAEYDEMLRQDLLQLQNVLGDKKFLLGDGPTRVKFFFSEIIYLGTLILNWRSRIHDLLDSPELLCLKEYLCRAVTRIFGDEFNDKK
ncbi:hypothetical protein PMAYCL1PPCAC_22183, partial [Pristionchus mayeri]